MSEMVPLGHLVLGILAGAIVAEPGEEILPIYPPQLRRCAAEVWPARGSKLARLIQLLHEPGVPGLLLEYVENTLTPSISRELRSMPYEEFLGTQYWWLVRGLLVTSRWIRCQECRTIGEMLDAHHLTYEHRGTEIFRLEDLQLLCRTCHFAKHNE